jgi:hypothetical protein
MAYDYRKMRELRDEEQKEAIAYLEEVAAWMEEYPKAIEACARAGVSNVRMAYTLGKTETAIRMYRQRHGL